MPAVDMHIERRQDALIASVRGSLDMNTCSDFDAKISSVIEQKPRSLVVDLSGITYINSLALGILVRAMQSLRASGGSLRLAAPSDYAAGVLKATKIGNAIPVLPTVDAAVA